MNNLLAKTDRKQQTIGYAYDALYRLTRKTYPDQRRMVSGGEWCQSAISLSQTKWFLTPFPDSGGGMTLRAAITGTRPIRIAQRRLLMP